MTSGLQRASGAKPQCTYSSQATARLKFVNVRLAKADHVAKQAGWEGAAQGHGSQELPFATNHSCNDPPEPKMASFEMTNL